ncbi:hypothetical protein FF011L_10180 [Roseimaritima multifibrata]|uniref:Uncharacterized protein n=1 Tax=Roseimaritima multifibrata TaxID=1930274 RepID=A0A517MBL4_9BACT|nr:hypothetical protein FF011L_10180 [Roseimaritima multifibrata]
MGVLAFSMTDGLLWAVAVAVAVTLFSGIMVRRRTQCTESLRDYVKRQRNGSNPPASNPPSEL